MNNLVPFTYYRFVRTMCCLMRLLQLQEQMEFDARMHEAIAEMQEKLGQEADEQLMERKRYYITGRCRT